jgi:phosphoribosylglycinamide formyltransferase-1
LGVRAVLGGAIVRIIDFLRWRGDVSAQRCKLAVLASGRGSNFKAIASSCAKDDFPAEVACLITDRPDAACVDTAREFGIRTHTVMPGGKKGRLAAGEEERIVELCREAGVGLVFLAGFMRILRGPLLEAYEGRILNIHPSLLPSFKGLHGPRQALEYGVKVAGCTVHFVDASVDGGPIILQAAVPVEDGDDEDALAARILREEHRIASEAIALVATGALQVEGRRVIEKTAR